MSHVKGMHPGAVWKKCDFQIHAPRDPQWTGLRFAGGSPELEQAREEWADQFVAECARRGLTAIAITDHHDFGFVPYVQRAIDRLPKKDGRLWLFPGTEVTCNDAVQCLVLFNAATTPETWERLFGGHLPTIEKSASDLELLPQAILCGKDITPFVSDLLKDSFLEKSAIVLVHASNEGAHKSMMRQGFHDRFKALTVDGVYTDKPLHNVEEKIIQRVHGKIPSWGTRRRGILPTSDSRHGDFRSLGLNECWIKLGEPTTEAIRQALLADEARIAYTSPTLPAQRVLEFRINSTLCGKDFQVVMNDGFTAIIGGRGSGKSAILEYLRFGLGRSTPDVISETGEYQRQRELIANTLISGSVEVILERNGVVEKWSRSGLKPDAISVEILGSPQENITISAAQQRFRARAFSQKQLSSLVTSADDAAEQITGIAAAEEIDQRQSLEVEIARARREVSASFDRVVDFWSAELDHQLASSSVKDLGRRLEANKKKLEESGLSEVSQRVLDEAPAHSSARALLAESRGILDSDAAEVDQLATKIPTIDVGRWQKVVHFEEVRAFIQELENSRTKLIGHFTNIKSAIQRISTARNVAAHAFNARFAEFKKQHEAASTEMANLSDLVAESSRLQSELEDAEARERKSGTRLGALQDSESRLKSARTNLDDQLAKNRALLGAAALKVSGMSAGMLRAEVRSESLPRQYVDSLLNLCESSRVREAQSRCEDRVARLLNENSGETWASYCDRWVEFSKVRLQSAAAATSSVSSTSPLQNLLFEVTAQQAAGIYQNLTSDKLSGLLTSVSIDYISFEYRDKHQHIPFQQASPGQQAAALLNLLLRQEAGTLIIDQPEDDLDNKVIMDIVRLLQTAKRKRQLIFTTHNANFLVNGDADKVVALTPGAVDPASSAEASLDSPRILIDVDGAIETPGVRTTITDTLEGGKEAFELRSRKYQFKLQ